MAKAARKPDAKGVPLPLSAVPSSAESARSRSFAARSFAPSSTDGRPCADELVELAIRCPRLPLASVAFQQQTLPRDYTMPLTPQPHLIDAASSGFVPAARSYGWPVGGWLVGGWLVGGWLVGGWLVGGCAVAG